MMSSETLMTFLNFALETELEVEDFEVGAIRVIKPITLEKSSLFSLCFLSLQKYVSALKT